MEQQVIKCEVNNNPDNKKKVFNIIDKKSFESREISKYSAALASVARNTEIAEHKNKFWH